MYIYIYVYVYINNIHIYVYVYIYIYVYAGKTPYLIERLVLFMKWVIFDWKMESNLKIQKV